MGTIDFVGVNAALLAQNAAVNSGDSDATVKKDTTINFGTTQVIDDLVNQSLFGETSENAAVGEATSNPTVENLIKQYKLDDKQAAVLRKLDLNQTLSDGSPKYSLVHVKRYGGSEDKGYFVVENSLDSNGKLSGKIIDPSSDKYSYGIDSSFEYKLTGTENVGNPDAVFNPLAPIGGNNIFAALFNLFNVGNITNNNVQNQTIAGGNTIIVGGNNYGPINGGGNVNNGGNQPDVVTPAPEQQKPQPSGGKIGIGENTFISPLILDTNRDGKVSATAGVGIDIDGDGKADGAATDGDKMLAMTDLNGNKKIDGSEVFGNKTVSPFTGKELNAKNGFEALKAIAQEAEARGFECIKDGKVDVQALQKALGTVNVKLGYVSDGNNTTVEDLKDIKTIDVENYKEVNSTGDVQHRQQGLFTWVDGTSGKIDDVWFKS